jgi:hypothetical protein
MPSTTGLTEDGSLRPLPKWLRDAKEIQPRVVVMQMLLHGSSPHPRNGSDEDLQRWADEMTATVAGWTEDERRYADWWLGAEILLASDNRNVSHPGGVPPVLAALGFHR